MTDWDKVHKSDLAEKAIKVLENKLVQDPKNTNTLELLGGLYRSKGKLEKSAKIFHQL